MKRPTGVVLTYNKVTNCDRLPDLDDGKFQDVEMWNLSPGFRQQDKNLDTFFLRFRPLIDD
jgi:hypothetical protein